MRFFKYLLFPLTALALLTLNCSDSNNHLDNNRVVVGISSDIETVNPLYAFSVTESYITDQIFLPLIHHTWNSELGEIESEPMLAESWKWNSDSTSINIVLRKDVKWTDGMPVTAEDVVYSFDIYSDPAVESRFFGLFKNFYLEENQHIDLTRSFNIISKNELKINFLPDRAVSLFAIDLPVLPKHIFNKIDRNKIKNAEINFKPVSDGAFIFYKWDKDQSVILKADQNSFLFNKNGIDELIFKIIPDYNSRLLQLQNSEIDIMTDIRPNDVSTVKSKEDLKIVPVKGNEYDYFGWSNIDLVEFNKSHKKVPNKLFGSIKVRQALTYALNRDEVIKNYLENRGEIAVGPIAPIFKSIYDSTLIPYEYNPEKAKKLLAEEGWTPSNKDGTLEKDGLRFSINLNIATGNPGREFAAQIYKNNLKAIGIEVNIEKQETGSFFQKAFSNQFNAWIAGWVVPIPIELKSYWNSDLKQAPFNLTGYGNPEVDSLLNEMDKRIPRQKRIKIFRRIQKILHHDQPVSFLYWKDNVVAYNSRINNIQITPIGPIYDCQKWEIKKIKD